LRVIQGLFMSAAFTLTLAYLAENVSARDATSAFASYITGNVASNLIGRLMSAALADHFGLATNFYVFACLNLAGALLVSVALRKTRPMKAMAAAPMAPWAALGIHLRNPALRASFAIGFLILFAFIGTYSYVNFVLTRAPIHLTMMSLGIVYLVFLPSIFTTPLAGRTAQRFGTRPTMWASLGVAMTGLPFLLAANLASMLIGLVLVGVGTFFAQATATGFVSQAATADRGAASGLYLASYFSGGLAGAAILGQLFDRWGWTATVVGIAGSLLLACLLAHALRARAAGGMAAHP
jgi:predicted MFS family arabinose efflux permease